MTFKLIALFVAYLAFVNGAVIAPAQPLAVTAQIEGFDPHPQYTYGYDVKDGISGDSKTQVETRNGDIVHGQYSLNDADGYRRIVDYVSDPINGFNAVVRREPLVAAAPVVKAAVAPPVAPVAFAERAPALNLVKTSFASPLVTYAY